MKYMHSGDFQQAINSFDRHCLPWPRNLNELVVGC
jgi:hypothetical protein